MIPPPLGIKNTNKENFTPTYTKNNLKETGIRNCLSSPAIHIFHFFLACVTFIILFAG